MCHIIIIMSTYIGNDLKDKLEIIRNGKCFIEKIQ